MTQNNSLPERPDRDHVEVQELLPEYVGLAVEGRDPKPVFPSVAKHLETCADCYEAFLDLLEMTEIGNSAALATVGWAPDLSFLPPAAAPRPEVTRPSPSEILIAYTRAIVDAFAQPQLTGALRGQLIHRALQKVPGTPPADITVEISAKDDLCTVEVHLYLHDRSSLQQDGTLVRLQAGPLAQEAVSDGMGRVSFQRVPLGALPLLRLTVLIG